jgi:hypothetical protein
MLTIKYQNEAIILFLVQNLTKRLLKTMEQILFFTAQCMLKPFQKKGDLFMRVGGDRL